MKSELLKRLGASRDEQDFLDQLGAFLTPYGAIARSQLSVDWVESRPEISCFVEMATPLQAMAARDGMGMVLLGDNCLFISVLATDKFCRPALGNDSGLVENRVPEGQ